MSLTWLRQHFVLVGEWHSFSEELDIRHKTSPKGEMSKRPKEQANFAPVGLVDYVESSVEMVW